MPELPEVETVKETLKTVILGKTIESIDVFYDKIIHGSSLPEFKSRLEGQTLRDIGRFGKYLLFKFDEVTLISHLRMEGKYFIKTRSEPVEKHEHIIFHFTDRTTLTYHDTRKFGTMELSEPGQEFASKGLLSMGPEPFDPGFTDIYLKAKAKQSIRPVKSFLLDQTVVSGLGNIYVDEVLFRAKLHPETMVKDLTDIDHTAIIEASRAVLSRAVELGGTTIRSYLSSLGVTGRFQNELHVHLRDKEPCDICGTPIIKIKVGGRGTYVCPTCQKRMW